jgi:DNA (cytosine-5)-methyltransferase 1
VKPWRPAREIIDWELKGRSIFNRKKPLAPKTLERIYAGAVKFGWPEPYLVILRNHMAGQSVDGPLPTIAANGGTSARRSR